MKTFARIVVCIVWMFGAAGIFYLIVAGITASFGWPPSTTWPYTNVTLPLPVFLVILGVVAWLGVRTEGP